MAVTDPVALPGTAVVVGAGVIALTVIATALIPPAGWVGRFIHSFCYLGTWIHELGHAAASVLTGGGVYHIEVHTPDSGVTHTWFHSWLSSVVTALAGYAAPPLMGLSAAGMISQGHTPLVLAIVVGVAILALPLSGDLFTLAVSVAIGGISAATLAWGPVGLQHWLAYTVAWFLLISELPSLVGMLVNRFRGIISELDDAHGLRELTYIPGVLWIAGWFTLVGWAVWTATPMLWG